jgi:CRP/FNR family cyclic AMP-dependent transcriptional regulator
MVIARRNGSWPDQGSVKEALRKVTLFSDLGDEDLATIAAQTTFKSMSKGTPLITEGEEARALYIIQRGRVKVYITDDEGKELILCTLGPGQCVGELAILDDELRSASVMATEQSCFLVLSKERFRECFASHPHVGLQLVKHLVLKIRQSTDDLRSLGLMDVYQRVVRVLLGLAQNAGDKLIIQPRPTNQDIANRVGASREMVSRILNELARGDYLAIETNAILVNRKLPAHW